MAKKRFKIFYTSVFLFILFSKVVISAAPILAFHFDKESINAVIMQLEIENNTKETEKAKEKTDKDLWHGIYEIFSFSRPLYYFSSTAMPIEDMEHKQSFYPTVPTPPPNC
jgi:hypothetical protein